MIIGLVMEAVNVSETSADFYQTTRANIPEHSRLLTRRCENLKSHVGSCFGTTATLGYTCADVCSVCVTALYLTGTLLGIIRQNFNPILAYFKTQVRDNGFSFRPKIPD
jgi:hypothetical protein